MASKLALVPGVGEVMLTKRRNARHIRLSVTPSGQIKVSLPKWTPFSAGVAFAARNRQWLERQKRLNPPIVLRHGQQIGKSHRIKFLDAGPSSQVVAKIQNGLIEVKSSLPADHPEVQSKAQQAGEKALRKEAGLLLPRRLELLAARHKFSYKEVKIKKLKSRWGSCSEKKVISLSYFLIQLPWQMIDYVLLHELVHTEHLNHSRDFWLRLEKALPNAKRLRAQIRDWRPRIIVP